MANPKSAYSVASKKEKSNTHIIVVWVDNEAGVLARVIDLFSGRGYNIESLAVCLLYTSPSPRDGLLYRMPYSA